MGLLVLGLHDFRLTDEMPFPKVEGSGISHDVSGRLTGKEYEAKTALFSRLDGAIA
jgi:hypothetical protein